VRQLVEFKLAAQTGLQSAQQHDTTVSLRRLPARCHHAPGAVSFDHQTVLSALLLALAHVLEIEPSPLPDHAFGIVFPEREKRRWYLYSAFKYARILSKRSGVDHTLLPANNTMPGAARVVLWLDHSDAMCSRA